MADGIQGYDPDSPTPVGNLEEMELIFSLIEALQVHFSGINLSDHTDTVINEFGKYIHLIQSGVTDDQYAGMLWQIAVGVSEQLKNQAVAFEFKQIPGPEIYEE